jgi:hypothetical protein
MAYPTTAQLSWQAVDLIGANLQSFGTTQLFTLGTVCRGKDMGSLGYGHGVFIYLKGVASTAAGDCVVYDPVAATTTRTVLATRGPIAIALSANVASNFGWYQIEGQAAANTASAGTGAANSMLAQTSTAGQLTVASAVAGALIGAICKSAQDTPTSGFTQVALTRGACSYGMTATGEAFS